MPKKHKKILHYEPSDNINNVCITDLTDISTNCIKHTSYQKHFDLFNSKNVKCGIFDTFGDNVIYSNVPSNSITTSTIIFTIIECNKNVKYSICTSGLYNDSNTDLFMTSNKELKFNLTCSVGNGKYTKLKWIFTSNDNIPSTRYLIFY